MFRFPLIFFIFFFSINNLFSQQLNYVDFEVLDIQRAKSEPDDYLKELQADLNRSVESNNETETRATILKLIALIDLRDGESAFQYNYLNSHADYLFKDGNTALALEIIDKGISYFKYYDYYEGIGFYQNAKSHYLWELGEFTESLLIQVEAVKNYEMAHGGQNYTTVLFKQKLGSKYMEFGEYDKAETLINETIEWAESNLNSSLTLLSSIYSQTGLLYYQSEDYFKALNFFTKSFELLKSNDGAKEEYRINLANRMNCLYSLGNVLEAKELFYQLNNYSINDIDELNNYSSAGQFISDLVTWSEIESKLVKWKNIDFTEMPLTERIQNQRRLIRILIQFNQLESAHDVMTKIINSYPSDFKLSEDYVQILTEYYYLCISKKKDNNINVIRDELNDLIVKLNLEESVYNVHFLLEKTREHVVNNFLNMGMSSISQAIEITKKLNIADQYDNLTQTKASILRRQGENKEASKTYITLMDKFYDKVFQKLIMANNQERNAIIKNNEFIIGLYESLALNGLQEDGNFLETAFRLKANYKGILLRNTLKFSNEQDDELSNNSGIQRTLRKLKSLKKKIEIMSFNPEKHKDDIKKLKNEIAQQEIVMLKIANVKTQQQNQLISSLTTITDKMSTNDVYIEYSSYKYFDGELWSDDKMYVAYILKKDWKYPKVVKLFEEKQLLQLIAAVDDASDLYKTRGSIAIGNANQIDYRDSIYSLVWKPLEKHIRPDDTIYFSPDGILHQISFSGLAQKNEKVLSDKYNLFRISNASTLVDGLSEPNFSSTLALGGVIFNYDLKDNGENHNESSYSPKNIINDLDRSNSNGNWGFLQGTEKELDFLEELFTTKNYKLDLLDGHDASEENFKKLSGNSPKILHLATHGYFYENSSQNLGNSVFSELKKPIYSISDDPLIRSGLILAGGNYAWVNGKAPPGKTEDGILTALEISSMDLSNTDLVVLSACDTGLGDINGSEGVYGLQRAFKMAGVELVLMTLWPIPDKETPEFMQKFYSDWLSGEKIRVAFKNAQTYMQDEYPDNPEFWAGFVLLE